MRFRELNEAGGFASFADQAVDTFDKLASTAGKAYGAFKGANAKAVGDIKSDISKAEAEAAKAKKEAEKAAAKEAKKKKPSTKELKDIPALVAKVTLDRTPDSTDIPEFDKFGAEDFNLLYDALEKAQDRISKFPRELRKTLKSSDFLQDMHKSDNELNEMLGEQSDRGIEGAEKMLMENMFDEQAAWVDVMVDDDAAGNAQRMISLIKAMSRYFDKQNDAVISTKFSKSGKGKSKEYPTGTGIIRLMSAQRQLIAIRLGLLKSAIDELAEKPVTEASLIRVRKLLERMK